MVNRDFAEKLIEDVDIFEEGKEGSVIVCSSFEASFNRKLAIVSHL